MWTKRKNVDQNADQFLNVDQKSGVPKTIKASPTKVRLLKSDPDRIRTYNRLSRNQERYPIAPRGHDNKKKASQMRSLSMKGDRRDLNPRLPEPQTGALPTELRSP